MRRNATATSKSAMELRAWEPGKDDGHSRTTQEAVVPPSLQRAVSYNSLLHADK